MFALFARWWELRCSPNPRVRVAWWAVLGALGLTAVFPRVALTLWVSLWTVSNVLLSVVAVVWGMFRPRAIIRGCKAAAGWGMGLAGLLALWLLTWAQTALPEYVGAELTPAIAFVLGLAIALFCFLALLPAALLGAALGAFATRGQAEAKAAPSGGARIFLAAMLVEALLLAAVPEYLELLQTAIVVTAPVATYGLLLLARRSECDPLTLAQRLGAWLSRRLIWRIRQEANAHRSPLLDFRGLTLGLVAGVFAGLVGASPVLAPLRNEVLVAFIRLRNQPVISSTMTPILGRPDPGAKEAAARMVLLDLDPITRRRIAATSEARVQAELLRKLHRWGVEQVVLPLPTLAAWWKPSPTARADTPRTTPATVARTVKDLPLLERALRETGNVVLAIPRLRLPTLFTFERQGPDLTQADVKAIRRLIGAAKAAGESDLEVLSARLPAIPLRWRPHRDPIDRFHLPAVPLLVASATSPVLSSATGRVARIAEREPATIAPEKVLVDFRIAEPGQAFPVVSYASVLSGAPLFPRPAGEFVPPSEAEVHGIGLKKKLPDWTETESNIPKALLPPLPEQETPEKFFRGKIVFLDSLQGGTRATPIGSMSRSELLGMATVSLLADRQIRRPPDWLLFLGLLVIGALMGALSARRAPLAVGLRLAAALAAIQLGAVAAFLGGSLWVDPLPAGLAVLTSALLVGQLTYLLERKEREDNRHLLQRFVAPQVVEELLERVDELGLGGQRQRLCVLFADARNFSTYSEQHAPEEVVETINAYTTAMTQALFAHKGILDKYTGDGLMAFFRISDSDGVDVASAVQAALAMRTAAEAVSAERQAQGRPTLPIGIGMHYGEAVVGLVGNPDRWDYTALGVTVVISQRLQGIAAGGEVVVSEALYNTAAGSFVAEAGEPVQVKGLARPVTPYRVLSLIQPPQLAPSPEGS